MADARLRIIIDALNKSSDDFKKLKKDIDGVDDAGKNAAVSTGKMDGGLTSLIATAAIATAAIGGTVLAMKQVYEAAREGADLMYLEDRFDNLTASIQTTSDALMNDMREATQGMMSDAKLMQSATDFMSLGLANSHDEVVRLSSVAGQLGMDMNQLVLTLTNQTTMRFDALGVSVDGFDEKVKALEESGMSVQDAFTEAFLQQAEEQIERVGSAADSAAGDFMRLEAQSKNLADAFKRNLSMVAAPIVKGLADQFNEAATFATALDNALMNGIITQQEYNSIQKDVRNGTLDVTDAILWAREEQIKYDAAVDQTAEDLIEASIQQALYGDAVEDSIGPVEDLTDATIGVDLAMRSYNEALLFSIASEGLTEEQALELAIAMGLVDENTMYAASQTDTLRQRLEDGIITNEQYAAAVANLADELDRIQSKSVTIDITTIRREIDELKRVGRDGVQAFTKASGGAVSAGNLYNWQEYGYRGEAFVPSQDGYVLSRSDAARIMQGGGGADVAAIVSRIPTAQDIARAVRDAILMVN